MDDLGADLGADFGGSRGGPSCCCFLGQRGGDVKNIIKEKSTCGLLTHGSISLRCHGRCKLSVDPLTLGHRAECEQAAEAV